MAKSDSPTTETEKSGAPTLAKQRVDQVSGLVWVAVGAFIVFHSRGLTYMDDYGPSAGFFPLWLGVIISLLGGILLVKSTWCDQEAESLSCFSLHAVYQMALIMAGLVGFILLIERVGFFLSVGLRSFFFWLASSAEGGNSRWPLRWSRAWPFGGSSGWRSRCSSRPASFKSSCTDREACLSRGGDGFFAGWVSDKAWRPRWKSRKDCSRVLPSLPRQSTSS